ncbi:MAG TPA: SAM-dependent methyltransferase [Actinomycetota bacterium]
MFDAVVEAIRDHGPITFAEFMELALYGPGGYYEQPPVGPAGDFVTSPHVHPVFGQLLAEAIRELHASLESPKPFELIDVGSGEGTLLRQILPELDDLPMRVTAVERSPGARAALEAIDGITVVSSLPEAPTGTGVVLAHELLDNLAFQRFRGTDEGLRQVCVSIDGDRLVETLTVPEVPPWPDGAIAIGHERILPTGAREFLTRAMRSAGGTPRYLMAIDYGSETADAGEVHGYRDHRVVEDVLAHPGRTDITAGVPFADLGRQAEADGAHAFPSVSQRAALTALGFEAWASAALDRQGDLLNTGRGGEAVRTWGGRSRATMLVDPAGLGRFRWFLVATPGLPEPPWLTRAQREDTH